MELWVEWQFVVVSGLVGIAGLLLIQVPSSGGKARLRLGVGAFLVATSAAVAANI